MGWHENVGKLSNRQFKELAGMCAGATLLMAIAFVLSGGAPLLPQQLKVAVQNINQTAGANSAAVAYWQTVAANYGGYPSPTSCSMNYQSGGYSSNCFQDFPGGILSALAVGTSNGTYTAGAYGVGGYAPCYPSTGRYYSAGFKGAATSSPLVVLPSTQVQLDWACQPRQTVSMYMACGDGWQYPSQNPIYTSSRMIDSSGKTYTASANPLIGSTTVTTTEPTGTVIYYRLYCSNGGKQQLNATIPVVVGPLPPPTVSITGNGTNPTTVIVGQKVTILGTFAPSQWDTLTKTSLNDYQNKTLPGIGKSLINKTYIFTPTATGTYLFYPSVQTVGHPGLDSYGKSLLVTAVATCPNGTGPAGACTSCNSGFHLVNGACIVNAPVCSGAHQVNPPTCSCDFGYTGPNGGPCTRAVCSNPNTVNPPTCSCKTGYVGQNGGPCTPAPPTVSIKATPPRMQKGTSTTITWTATDITVGATVACSIESSPAGVFSKSMPVGTAPQWSGSGQTGGVTGTTLVTLLCTGGASKSITIGLVPDVKEI